MSRVPGPGQRFSVNGPPLGSKLRAENADDPDRAPVPGTRNKKGTRTELRPRCSLPLPKLPGRGNAEKDGVNPPTSRTNKNVDFLMGAPTPYKLRPGHGVGVAVVSTIGRHSFFSRNSEDHAT